MMRVFHLLIGLSISGCASFERQSQNYSTELDEYNTQDGYNSEANNIDAFDIELITTSKCTNPCVFMTKVDGASLVRYSANGWTMGSSSSQENDYLVEYEFHTVGVRNIMVEALDESDKVIASTQAQVLVENNEVQLITSSECADPCEFKAETSGDIVRVSYFADDWMLGNSINSDDDYAINYDFNYLGNRYIEAVGYNQQGEELAVDGRWVEVYGDSFFMPDVPYYYQHANAYNPSGSCQNTSVAMLLSYYGHTILPDDISYDWGTSHAQSPAGLSAVFNHYAAQSNLPQYLIPITDGSISELKSELDAGRPVIIHGYFTSYGHIMVVLGYDENGYWVNDPAGKWSEQFRGGYPYGWNVNIGHGIYYSKSAFEAAVATSDGYNYLPLWYSIVR